MGFLSLMDTQYKFRWIRRDDNGFITEAGVAFFEGTYLPNQPIIDSRTGDILGFSNQFLATKKLDKNDLKYIKAQKYKQSEGIIENEPIYEPIDFGVISTDDELRAFMNTELAKDKTRTQIPEQVV